MGEGIYIAIQELKMAVAPLPGMPYVIKSGKEGVERLPVNYLFITSSWHDAHNFCAFPIGHSSHIAWYSCRKSRRCSLPLAQKWEATWISVRASNFYVIFIPHSNFTPLDISLLSNNSAEWDQEYSWVFIWEMEW